MNDAPPTLRYWVNDILVRAGWASVEPDANDIVREIENLAVSGHIAHFHYATRPKSRYGWGSPPHHLIERKIVDDTPTIRQRLKRCAGHREFYASIAPSVPDPDTGQPYWGHQLLPAIDAISICSMIEEFSPKSFVEIGSGNSTRFARSAIKAFAPNCALTSIDAYPGDTISAVPDTMIAKPLEDVDLSIFRNLVPNDIVWLDGSHHAFSGTDVSVFFLDVMPLLQAGVIIGIHDIPLPWDYPPSWGEYYFNELQMLGSYLVGNIDRIEILFPALYIAIMNADLKEELAPLLSIEPISKVRNDAGAFWFRRR